MNLVIDRERWLRGEENAKLIRSSDGKMCCLGFFLKACGVPDEVLLDVADPDDPFAGDDAPECPEAAEFLLADLPFCAHNVSSAGYSLMGTNDIFLGDIDNEGFSMTEARREEEITRLFAENGVDVTFVDQVPA